MEHNKTLEILKIPWEIIEADDSQILKRYMLFRAYHVQRVWYPCVGGYVCFGTDAETYIGGLKSSYMSIPMCFTDEPDEGQVRLNLVPSKMAPTGVRGKMNLLLLKLLGVLT